jgi:hypothetical protein
MLIFFISLLSLKFHPFLLKLLLSLPAQSFIVVIQQIWAIIKVLLVVSILIRSLISSLIDSPMVRILVTGIQVVRIQVIPINREIINYFDYNSLNSLD